MTDRDEIPSEVQLVIFIFSLFVSVNFTIILYWLGHLR